MSHNFNLIENINIQDTNLASFQDGIRSLATMPNLKSLYITLTDPDEVEIVRMHLHDLEFLNGKKLEADEIEVREEDDDDEIEHKMAESEEEEEGDIQRVK